MKVIVSGASGVLGRRLLPRLVSGGHEVVGIVRRPEAVADVEAAGATAALIDLETDDAGFAALLPGADAVVWTAGANLARNEHSDRLDREATVRAIDAAAAAGLPRWIHVSSLYSDRIEQAPPVLAHFLGNKVVAENRLKDSTLAWTVLRPSGLNDEEATGGITAVREGLGYGSLARADLADAIAVLLEQDLGAGLAFDLTGGDTPVEAALRSL